MNRTKEEEYLFMENIAQYIDHTILNADATETDVRRIVKKQKNTTLKRYVFNHTG